MNAPGRTLGSEPCVACDHRGLALRFRIGEDAIYTCSACGTTHVRPLPDSIRLHQYYDADYALVGHVGRGGAEAKARGYAGTEAVADLLARFAPGARTVAEIGCSSGYLLWGLRERGLDVEGFELSAVTSEAARRELGLRVTTAALPPADRVGAYDAIVMRHVLEHVLDPGATVVHLRSCLRPGGILVLATPNAASLAARLCGADWEWMSPPAHLHLFTPAGLRALLARSGLVAEWSRTQRGDARPLAIGLLRRVASRLGVRRVLTARLGNLQGDGGGGGAAARGSLVRRLVLAAGEGLDRVLSPLGAVAAGPEGAEELWMIGRR